MADKITIGVLRALLTADVAEFEAGMRKATNSLAAFSKDTGTIGRQATALGASLTKTLTLPLAAFGVAATKAAIDFESSFADVRKTVDATDAEFKQMERSLRDLAKTIPINVNELNRLAGAAGALGIPKDAIVEFSRVMALLGETTNVTADEAASAIAKIQNIFQAAGQDTDRFAATLVDLGNKGASTEGEILALANRIASAGNAIGLTQGEVLGFASAIANVGIEAEAGGSAISRVFNDIATAVAKGGKDLQAFANIALPTKPVEEFARLFKTDAAEAVRLFVEGLGKVHTSGGELIVLLDNLGFKELRQANTLRSLALSGDNLAKALTIQRDAWAANNALTAEAEERFKTVAAQLQLLWNNVRDVGITIGNVMLPAITAAVNLTREFVPLIEGLAQAFAALPTSVQMAALGAALAAIAAGPTIFAFGQLTLAVSGLAGAFGAGGILAKSLSLFGISAAGATTAVSLLTAAFVAAGVAVAGFAAGFAAGKWLDSLTIAGMRPSQWVEFLTNWKLGMGGIDAATLKLGITTRGAFEEWENFKKSQGIVASKNRDIQLSAEGAASGTKSAADAAREAEVRMANLARSAEKTKEELKKLAEQKAWIQSIKDATFSLQRLALGARLGADGIVEIVSAANMVPPAMKNMSVSTSDAATMLQSFTLDAYDFEHAMEAVPKAIASQNVSQSIERAKGFWDDLGARVANVAETMQAAINGSFAQMLLGSKGFKDGFLDIWHSIKAGVMNILNEILSAFINAFLKGMIGALTGSQGAFSSAFSGLLSGGMSAGVSALTGGGAAAAAGGAAAAAGGAGAAGAAGAAGGGAGLAGAGGISLTTGLATAGIGAAAVLAYWAIVKKGLFRGGEEALKVNPNRDKFFAQYGGYAGLAELLTVASDGDVADALLKLLYAADTRREFDEIQKTIVALVGGQMFHRGGMVPGTGEVPAMLLGGERVLNRDEASAWRSPGEYLGRVEMQLDALTRLYETSVNGDATAYLSDDLARRNGALGAGRAGDARADGQEGDIVIQIDRVETTDADQFIRELPTAVRRNRHGIRTELTALLQPAAVLS